MGQKEGVQGVDAVKLIHRLQGDSCYFKEYIFHLTACSNFRSHFSHLSLLQNDLFAQTLRYAQNFILGISTICLR
jgi:hypothetical protein